MTSHPGRLMSVVFDARISKSKTKHSLYRPGQALWFQEVEAPKISRQSAHEDRKMSAVRTGRLYPHQGIPLVLISVSSLVDPRATVRPEVLCQWKQICDDNIE
jgi:hypothetical protein